jgi:hypothetical protein
MMFNTSIRRQVWLKPGRHQPHIRVMTLEIIAATEHLLNQQERSAKLPRPGRYNDVMNLL